MATAADNIQKYQERLSNTNSKIGLALASVVGVVSVTSLLVFTDYFNGSPLPMWFAIVGLAVVGIIARFLNKNPSRTWLACYYGLFHVLAGSFFFIVTPQQYFPPPYIIYWVLLSTVTYLDIGRKVFIGSVASLGVLIALKLALTQPAYSAEKIVEVLVFYAFFLYIVFYLYLITTIASDEQKTLGEITLQAEFEKKKLEAAINSMEEAVMLCDDKLVITMRNGATNLLLNTHADVMGTHIDELLNLRNVKGEAQSIHDILDQPPGTQIAADYTHYFSAKNFINLNIFTKSIELQTANGPQRNYMVVLRDITKEKSLEEERDEFIAIMSHELRTPVSIVEGGLSLAQLFLVKKEYEKLGSYLGKAQNSTTLLAEIINSLSSLVENEKYGDTIQVATVKAKQITDVVYKESLTSAEAKKLKLSVRIGADVPDIETNKDYVVEIVQNFVANAVKYTKTGTIDISATKQDDDHVTFAVRDSGIGMTTADISHVFEKFWRSENYETRESGGTGLGLYITKKLADSLHGELHVESELEKGSVFSLTIPVKFPPKA